MKRIVLRLFFMSTLLLAFFTLIIQQPTTVQAVNCPFMYAGCENRYNTCLANATTAEEIAQCDETHETCVAAVDRFCAN